MESTTLDYLIRHLSEYGNTVMPQNKKAEDYLDVLREKGFDCIVRVVPEIIEGKRSRHPYQILEIKGKVVPFKSNYQRYYSRRKFNV